MHQKEIWVLSTMIQTLHRHQNLQLLWFHLSGYRRYGSMQAFDLLLLQDNYRG